jgi:hypothetical protein
VPAWKSPASSSTGAIPFDFEASRGGRWFARAAGVGLAAWGVVILVGGQL